MKKTKTFLIIIGFTGGEKEKEKETVKSIFAKTKVTVTAIERIANEDIQKAMNHKLNFKKNPHNDPKTVQNVLIKHIQKNPTSTSNYLTKNINVTQNHGNSSKLLESGQKRKEEKQELNGFMPLFQATPETLEFTEYSVGEVMKISLSLLNISTISRSIRVVPPSSERFGMSPLIYPSGKEKINRICDK